MRANGYERKDGPAARGRRRSSGVPKSALKGAAAGLVGGMAMMMAMKLEQRALLPEEQRTDPPPKRLVEALAREQAVPVTATQARAVGRGVHMGYSALWGALFGVVQDRVHPPEILHGLLLGGLVYAANFPEWGMLPRLGVLPPPSEQEPEQEVVPAVAHVVFGLATAKAFQALH